VPAKFVFVTELKCDKTKTGKDYSYCLDQDKVRWNFFNGEKVELQKGYVFDYEVSGEYSNVKKITPVINVFKQEAMKDVASKNDIKRDLTTSLSYAKDLVIAKILDIGQMEAESLKLYRFINSESDKILAEIQTPKPEIK
jgi:hypothetical protein